MLETIFVMLLVSIVIALNVIVWTGLAIFLVVAWKFMRDE